MSQERQSELQSLAEREARRAQNYADLVKRDEAKLRAAAKIELEKSVEFMVLRKQVEVGELEIELRNLTKSFVLKQKEIKQFRADSAAALASLKKQENVQDKCLPIWDDMKTSGFLLNIEVNRNDLVV